MRTAVKARPSCLPPGPASPAASTSTCERWSGSSFSAAGTDQPSRGCTATRSLSFDVDGKRPAVVDMPTMWVHNITNTGDTELTTLFWTQSLFDPAAPDTFREPVGQVLAHEAICDLRA